MHTRAKRRSPLQSQQSQKLVARPRTTVNLECATSGATSLARRRHLLTADVR